MAPSHDPTDLDAQLPALMLFLGLVGESDPMRSLYRKIVHYGRVDAPVLITGETGTGKELVARAIHASSERSSGPLVALNCAAINEDLFASELFGHEKGAFTGAVTTHRGRFERADGGTLFLDEFGEMPAAVQAQFLRVLEHGTFERVGGEKELRSDVRVVAATNQPLERNVQRGQFRADLYHRVAVLRVHVPALRERRGDLPNLVGHFLRMFNERYDRGVERLSPEALRSLEEYAWPGNVRELRNVLERVYVESAAPVIGRNAFLEWEQERDLLAAGQWNVSRMDEQRFAGPALIVPAGVYQRMIQALPGPQRADGVGRFQELPFTAEDARILDVSGELGASARVGPAAAERSRKPRELTPGNIEEAYAQADGNLTHAAELLGVHKTTLYRAMKRHGMTRDSLAAGRDAAS